MSGEPSVSIAIRAYRRRWLGEAIASVLSQTYRDLELVVYDDAGDLEDVVASFEDERVRYHVPVERRPTTAGRYKAAVALCRGRYIGVLDDDDRYEPEFVSRLAAALDEHPRAAAAVATGHWEDGSTLYPMGRRAAGVQEDAAQAFMDFSWPFSPSLMLIRRSALDEGEERWPLPDDVWPDFFVSVRAAAAGWQFVVVDSPLVVRRLHDEQISHDSATVLDHAVATWRQLPLVDPELDRLRRHQLARSHARRAEWRLLRRDGAGARLDLRLAREASAGSCDWKWWTLRSAAAVPPLGRTGLRIRARLTGDR